MQAQNYRVIYSFTGGMDGALPEAGLTGDAAGNLYGTTYSGGLMGPGHGIAKMGPPPYAKREDAALFSS